MGTDVDLTTWQLWWRFNRDAYLGLEDALRSGAAASKGDNLFLGYPDREKAIPLSRPDRATVEQRIVPALMRALDEARDDELTASILLALGRIGVASEEVVDVVLAHFSSNNRRLAETAVLAGGLLGDDRATTALADLLLDSENGRRLCARGSVPERTRAFAAYGLGLAGKQSKKDDVRRFVVHELVRVLHEDEGSIPDLHVASTIALGLVPLNGAWTADEREFAASSRGGQLSVLLDILGDDRAHRTVRAQAPRALALLADGAPEAVREEIVDAILHAAGRRSKAPQEVRQGCTLALGMLGDADADPVDVRIREELQWIAADGDQVSRRFALISLGQVAGHPGTGAGHPLEGTADVRAFLLARLSKSAPLRPWCALGLGVLGRTLVDHGHVNSSDVARALAERLGEARSPEEVGALSIAAGLHGGGDPAEALLSALQRSRDETLRGYACIGLGLADAQEGRGAISEALGDAWHEPTVMREATIGLALLGRSGIVARLSGMMAEADCDLARAGVASSLGLVGDGRAVDPLLELLDADSKPARVRAYAANALGSLADGDDLPWWSWISAGSNYFASPSSLTSADRLGILDVL